ncbi:MAG: sugar phosphate isomerase/epimerase, partial [Planctomycetota bacterium]|nr:sugar phosphate isomerase/epimerase [Planctomycetota bacterium]
MMNPTTTPPSPTLRRTSRRELLAMGAAAVAASAWPVRAETPARIKHAVKYGMIRAGSTPLEKLTLLKTLGYDGVEIDSPSNLDLDAVIAARDETGITIHGVVDSVHWKHTLSDASPDVRAKGRAGLETALRDCKKVGGSTVLLVPAVVRKNVPYQAAYERSQAEIKKVLPLAAELGIKIAIENVWNHFLLSPMEAARYIDEFESEHIGWYFDVGNIVNYGWPEHWIDTLGKRIFKLDIKEFSRKRRNSEGLWKGFGVKIGDGDCGWKEVRAALDRIGYTGWATAEVGGGGEERLK